MTYVEFNLIRVISARIITAAISTAYCSFAYFLHGSLLKRIVAIHYYDTILILSEGCIHVFIYLNFSVLNIHLDAWKERTQVI